MKVLVVGSGGREHALVWKLKQSDLVEEIFCAPGNAGTARIARNLPIAAYDAPALLDCARSQSINLTVVGPEAPLAAGLVDVFQDEGLAAAGPRADAARLESSKAFAKDFMQRHRIPTARYRLFEEADAAERSLRSGEWEYPVVLKADGLAAGKGVLICPDLEQSLQGVGAIMRQRRFGQAGDRLVIEEFLDGEEASFMAFCDGERLLPMVPSQDHKKIGEGETGPNTGGMGAYSVDSILDRELRRRVLAEVMRPAVEGMAQEGCPFSGVLYAGLMLTTRGPKVLEFNVRLGDPETQVVLPRLKSDLAQVMLAMAEGSLQAIDLEWDDSASVCVVLAAPGYPGSYPKGMAISGIEMAEEGGGTVVFHAGSSLDEEGAVVASGGRVLGVTSWADSLPDAVAQVYEGVNRIRFDGMCYRRDIAAKGLSRTRA